MSCINPPRFLRLYAFICLQYDDDDHEGRKNDFHRKKTQKRNRACKEESPRAENKEAIAIMSVEGIHPSSFPEIIGG